MKNRGKYDNGVPERRDPADICRPAMQAMADAIHALRKQGETALANDLTRNRDNFAKAVLHAARATDTRERAATTGPKLVPPVRLRDGRDASAGGDRARGPERKTVERPVLRVRLCEPAAPEVKP